MTVPNTKGKIWPMMTYFTLSSTFEFNTFTEIAYNNVKAFSNNVILLK